MLSWWWTPAAPIGELAQAVETLRQTPVNILGAVLNKLEAKGRGRYYYYQYTSYGDGASDGAEKGLSKRVLGKLTFGRLNGSKQRHRSSSRRDQASATRSAGMQGSFPLLRYRSQETIANSILS